MTHLADPPVVKKPTSGNGAIDLNQKHNFSRSYRELDIIPTTSLAIAPRNPSYESFRAQYPDPLRSYLQLRPNEDAREQAELYTQFLITGRDTKTQRSLLLGICKDFSPLIVPESAVMSHSPRIREYHGHLEGLPPYIRAELRWSGEKVGIKPFGGFKPVQQLTYAVRIHTNTREVVGQPPSMVISRVYAEVDSSSGRTLQTKEAILLAPELMIDRFPNQILSQITQDNSGNRWISLCEFERVNQLRSDREFRHIAHAVLESVHHKFWRRKIVETANEMQETV